MGYLMQRLLTVALLLACIACSSEDAGLVPPDNESDTTMSTDGQSATDATDGLDATDGETGTDATDPPVVDIVCENPWTNSNDTDLCTTTSGGETIWLRGDVMTPTGSLKAGSIIIQQGRIACVGCDCTAENATIIECPNSMITPGLINPHDHLAWSQDTPAPDTGERYDHRHEWRRGKDCGGPSGPHDELNFTKNSWNRGELWGELRMMLGGATSIAGSGGEDGRAFARL